MHVFLAALALAAFHPGDRASIDVSVATLWKAPNIYRAIDRPSVTNPADPAAWSRNLATTADRVWLDSHVQTQALYGQQVTILAVRNGWLPLRQLKPAIDDSGSYLVVRARTATLHVAGKTLQLSYGTRLPRIAGNRVKTPDGEGTITGAALPLAPSNASIIAQGKRFLGVHYLWGGLSSYGFDCSGLIWDLYRAHGLTIPRDADPQMHHGTPVARSALKPGDLLFFGSKNYADHVSIYLGNDRQLEAPDSAHRVRVSPVRWTYYIGARRYLTR